MDVDIRRLSCRYQAVNPREPPSFLAARLDRIARYDVPRELADATARILGDDPAVYVLRRLRDRVSVRLGERTTDADVARRWAESLAAAIARALSEGAAVDGGLEVMRFAGRAEFAARFLADLVAGEAWERWYYHPFAALAGRPAPAVIEDVFDAHREESDAILAQLQGLGALPAVLAAAAPGTLERLWPRETARRGAGEPEVRSLVRLALSLAERLELTRGGASDAEAVLARYLARHPAAADWRDRGSLAEAVLDVLRFLEAEGHLVRRRDRAVVPGLLASALDDFAWLDTERLEAWLTGEGDAPAGRPGSPLAEKPSPLSPPPRRRPTPRQKELLADLRRALEDAPGLDLARGDAPANALRLLARLVERAPRWAGDRAARHMVALLLRAGRDLARKTSPGETLRLLLRGQEAPEDAPDLAALARLGADALAALETLANVTGTAPKETDAGPFPLADLIADLYFLHAETAGLPAAGSPAAGSPAAGSPAAGSPEASAEARRLAERLAYRVPPWRFEPGLERRLTRLLELRHWLAGLGDPGRVLAALPRGLAAALAEISESAAETAPAGKARAEAPDAAGRLAELVSLDAPSLRLMAAWAEEADLPEDAAAERRQAAALWFALRREPDLARRSTDLRQALAGEPGFGDEPDLEAALERLRRSDTTPGATLLHRRLESPPPARRDGRTVVETGCAGVFLLLRAVLDARLPAVVAQAAPPFPEDAAPSPLGAVLTALGLCWGGEAALPHGHLDTGLSWLAGWPSPPSLSGLRGAWKGLDGDQHRRLQAALLRVLARHRLLGETLHLQVLPLDGAEALVAGTGDFWLLGRPLVAEEPGEILAAWREDWRQATGRDPSAVVCRRGVLAPEDAPGLELLAVDEVDGMDGMEEVSLREAWAALGPGRLVDPGAELTAGLAAAALLRLWARWLHGFAGASVPFLLTHFVRRPGWLVHEGNVLVVEMAPLPLDVALEMAGYTAELEPQPWLSDRRIRFRIGGRP